VTFSKNCHSFVADLGNLEWSLLTGVLIGVFLGDFLLTTLACWVAGDFDGVDLAGDLDGVDFEGVDFAGVNFVLDPEGIEPVDFRRVGGVFSVGLVRVRV